MQVAQGLTPPWAAPQYSANPTARLVFGKSGGETSPPPLGGTCGSIPVGIPPGMRPCTAPPHKTRPTFSNAWKPTGDASGPVGVQRSYLLRSDCGPILRPACTSQARAHPEAQYAELRTKAASASQEHSRLGMDNTPSFCKYSIRTRHAQVTLRKVTAGAGQLRGQRLGREWGRASDVPEPSRSSSVRWLAQLTRRRTE